MLMTDDGAIFFLSQKMMHYLSVLQVPAGTRHLMKETGGSCFMSHLIRKVGLDFFWPSLCLVLFLRADMWCCDTQPFIS